MFGFVIKLIEPSHSARMSRETIKVGVFYFGLVVSICVLWAIEQRG
jgi:hypothetical protein